MKGGDKEFMKLKSIMPKNKKGGVVTATVMGIGGLIIGVIIILVIVSTLRNANLLEADTIYDNATDNLAGNFTDGLDEISSKIPTILLIVAVVFLFGALVLLVRNANQMGIGG
ncbi:unnamed protein product, partial [marine sediment metagenome]